MAKSKKTGDAADLLGGAASEPEQSAVPAGGQESLPIEEPPPELQMRGVVVRDGGQRGFVYVTCSLSRVEVASDCCGVEARVYYRGAEPINIQGWEAARLLEFKSFIEGHAGLRVVHKVR